jgi:hypothetical protein
MPACDQNSQIIKKELQWLYTVINNRIKDFLNQKNENYRGEEDPPALDISNTRTHFTNFIRKYSLSLDERKVVLLALALEIQPELLDCFLTTQDNYQKVHTEFGGSLSSSINGFIPTLKTALFVLGGPQLDDQIKYIGLLNKSSKLYTAKILKHVKQDADIPVFHRQLALSDQALSLILTGEDVRHEYCVDFPARRLTTSTDWEDLVLPSVTALGLKELLAWPETGSKLIDQLQMGKHIQRGYRALF